MTRRASPIPGEMFLPPPTSCLPRHQPTAAGETPICLTCFLRKNKPRLFEMEWKDKPDDALAKTIYSFHEKTAPIAVQSEFPDLTDPLTSHELNTMLVTCGGCLVDLFRFSPIPVEKTHISRLCLVCHGIAFEDHTASGLQRRIEETAVNLHLNAGLSPPTLDDQRGIMVACARCLVTHFKTRHRVAA